MSNAFYEGTPSRLSDQLRWCFLHKVGPRSLPGDDRSGNKRSLAIVSPHAGYVYSGPVAAHGYLALSKEPPPDVAVILGPNHTGNGAGISIWGEGGWLTPLGRLEVDERVSRAIASSGSAELDEDAHEGEHSIEVQLPFLQYAIGSNMKIVPVCMMLQDFESSRELGLSIAEALKGMSAVIIASTDFSHYVPYRDAYRKDAMVGSAITGLDARAIEETVRREGVSMCGPGPVMAAMTAAIAMGAKSCEKLCYATSGDTSGDKEHVVGYGSFIIRG